jgi:hypothetical protein
MIGANQTVSGVTDVTDVTHFLYPPYVCVRAHMYRGGTKITVTSVTSVTGQFGLECGA